MTRKEWRECPRRVVMKLSWKTMEKAENWEVRRFDFLKGLELATLTTIED